MQYQFRFAEMQRKHKTTASGQQEMIETWVETDTTETSSKAVMAGILRAKANELDPPAKVY
jgi:hypothetical protein